MIDLHMNVVIWMENWKNEKFTFFLVNGFPLNILIEFQEISFWSKQHYSPLYRYRTRYRYRSKHYSPLYRYQTRYRYRSKHYSPLYRTLSQSQSLDSLYSLINKWEEDDHLMMMMLRSKVSLSPRSTWQLK